MPPGCYREVTCLYSDHCNYTGSTVLLFVLKIIINFSTRVILTCVGITDAHHQPAQQYIKGGMTAASGGYNMGEALLQSFKLVFFLKACTRYLYIVNVIDWKVHDHETA